MTPVINKKALRKRYDDLALQVDRVLWEDWDPIGVNKMGGPTDEYCSYVPRIVGLLLDGADTFKISHHLSDLEHGSMGLRPSPDRNEQIAKKLLACLTAGE